MEKISCDSIEEYNNLKHKAMMIKMILLDKGGDNPMTNPAGFPELKKRRFLKEMGDYMSHSIESIEESFNEIVNHKLLSGEADISQYPVYETTEVE